MTLRSRFALLAALLALVSAAPLPAAADELVSLKAGYLSLSPEGSFAGNGGGSGSDIDFEGDLDFGDSQEFTLEAALQIFNLRLSAAWLPLRFSGSGTLDGEITFDGATFTAGETVSGDVDADLYDLALAFYLLNFDDLPVRVQLGPELAIKVVDGDATLRSRTTGESEEVSGTAAVPTLGGRARVALADLVGVAGRIGYLDFDGNSFLDADIQVEFSPVPLLGVFAGYRYLDLDVDESGLVIDADFSGPYGGLLLRF